jgi:hypothetical protein
VLFWACDKPLEPTAIATTIVAAAAFCMRLLAIIDGDFGALTDKSRAF